MAKPTTAINRFDLSLNFSEFNEVMNAEHYIGLQVLPPVMVAEQSASFGYLPKEALLGPIEDVVRAPKKPYKRDDFEWEQASYATKESGVEEPMDDRLIRVYGSEIRAETIHARRVRNRLLTPFENAVASAVFNTTTWTGSDLTTDGTDWTHKTNGLPIDDIDAAVEKVYTNSGHRPNTLILTEYLLRKMSRTNQITDLLKYSGRDDPKMLHAIAGLKELLRLDKILVADGIKNTANKGKDAAFSRLWDTSMAMVCTTHNSPDLEDPSPRIGCTIMWSEENAEIPGADDGTPGIIVEEYREENVRGSVLRGRHDYQLKILYPQSGHLLTGLTS